MFQKLTRKMLLLLLAVGAESAADQCGGGLPMDDLLFIKPVHKRIADRICCNNHRFAEPSGFQDQVGFFSQLDANGVNIFYDSVCGKPLFKAPVGRSFADWVAESRKHGWPSFRAEETFTENVNILPGGRMESVCGTHLGHNLPDKLGGRYCIDLVCMAGRPAEVPVAPVAIPTPVTITMPSALKMGGAKGVGPAWTYDPSAEKPAGTMDMGGWQANVFTPEQQARLGVDTFGKAVALAPPVACCYAMTADCLACAAGISVEEYCKLNSKSFGCEKFAAKSLPPVVAPVMCCKAMTADCFACSAGVTVEEFCNLSPGSIGCEKFAPPPVMCCMAMTADCLACAAGVSVEQYCQSNSKSFGCEMFVSPPVMCCMAMTADCLACSKGVTVEQYCESSPTTTGCVKFVAPPVVSPVMCCMAMTADCLACSAGISVEEYCKSNTETAGCAPAKPAFVPRRCCRAMTAKCMSCATGMTPRSYCKSKPATPGCKKFTKKRGKGKGKGKRKGKGKGKLNKAKGKKANP